MRKDQIEINKAYRSKEYGLSKVIVEEAPEKRFGQSYFVKVRIEDPRGVRESRNTTVGVRDLVREWSEEDERQVREQFEARKAEETLQNRYAALGYNVKAIFIRGRIPMMTVYGEGVTEIIERLERNL